MLDGGFAAYGADWSPHADLPTGVPWEQRPAARGLVTRILAEQHFRGPEAGPCPDVLSPPTVEEVGCRVSELLRDAAERIGQEQRTASALTPSRPMAPVPGPWGQHRDPSPQRDPAGGAAPVRLLPPPAVMAAWSGGVFIDRRLGGVTPPLPSQGQPPYYGASPRQSPQYATSPRQSPPYRALPSQPPHPGSPP
eukprot:Hpha_TRINITY_DN16509_c1_g7::TRINITY_DN16509_c1_g7_i1::g.135364::m.135364